MPFHAAFSSLAPAPVRMGLTVTTGIAGLPGTFAAVRHGTILGTILGAMHSLFQL